MMFASSGRPFPVRTADLKVSPVTAAFNSCHGQDRRVAFFSNLSTRSSSCRVRL
jgi:hypothetical protein